MVVFNLFWGVKLFVDGNIMVNVDKEGKVELKVVFVIVGMYEVMVLVGND